jgi:hypothetical protein
MSVERAVQVGAETAQAAIDAAERFGLDGDTALLRFGVMQLLQLQANDLTADGEDGHLLDAYRRWITVALRYYAPQPDADSREYAHAAAILSAELGLASRRSSPPNVDSDATRAASDVASAITTG